MYSNFQQEARNRQLGSLNGKLGTLNRKLGTFNLLFPPGICLWDLQRANLQIVIRKIPNEFSTFC